VRRRVELRQPAAWSPRKRAAVGAALVVGSAAAIAAVAYALSRRRTAAGSGVAPSLVPSPAPLPPRTTLEKLAADAAYATNVPPAVVFGIIKAETNWSNSPTPYSAQYGTECITSKAGAVGLMQLLPATARQMGVTGDLCNPANNLIAGSRYLRYLYTMFRDWKLVALAYNQGPGNVKGYVASGVVSQGGNKLPDGRRTVTVRGMAYADKVLTEAARRGLAGAGAELDEPVLALL
jgi:soluble lytic murein transglycosylase-like protein